MGLKKKKTFAFIKNRLQNRLKNRQIYLLSQCIILHMDIDWKSIIINKERLLWLTGNRIQKKIYRIFFFTGNILNNQGRSRKQQEISLNCIFCGGLWINGLIEVYDLFLYIYSKILTPYLTKNLLAQKK